MFFIITLAAAMICVIHITILWRIQSLTTHTARLTSLIAFICAPVIFTAAILLTINFAEWGTFDPLDSLGELLGIIGIVFGVTLLVAPTFLAFSVPGNFIFCMLTIALYAFSIFAGLTTQGYGGFCIIIFLLVAWWFPWHRRLVEYCRPETLPHLPKYVPPKNPPTLLSLPPAAAPPPLHSRSRQGVTLIELLIVVLMIAIFASAIASGTSTAYQMERHQRRWRQAIDLAQDQFALLRARAELPALGVHPLDEELAPQCPVDAQARITIFAGPNERLRKVYVTIDLAGAEEERRVSLATIMPANRSGGNAP
jgi:prepilin-type N-terminal cleavage/methylation domain-containing protein